jgi:tripeptidyl-peptidase-1
MGAVIALVNDALIAEGKPTLGFLNPWLYGGGWKAFTDVTVGESTGCNTTGFPAAVGWDPVSGFGTPVSDIMKENFFQYLLCYS